MTRTPAARRPAFTLLELLVVIALIAVIAAAAFGVFGLVRGNVEKTATDATLSKINAKLDQRINAINVQVTDDVKQNHPGYATVLAAVQNPDLAKAIWTHAKTKSELPMSRAEARTAVSINIGGTVVYTIPVKTAFNVLPPEPAGPNQAFDESAACLYTALTANAGGGTATDTDGFQQQTGVTAGGAKCFKDGWGTPIAFVRMAYNAEVTADFKPTPSNPTPFDPFDPRRRLLAWPAAARDQFWNAIKPNVTWAGPVLAQNTYPGALHHTSTAISAGPNKQWATTTTGGEVFGLGADTDLGKDNQVSYRLRREGGRGE